MADSRTEVLKAEEALRQARDVLQRVRNLQVTVRGAWQQMDDLPEGAADELRRRLAEVVTAWAKDLDLLMQPAWQAKVESHYAADTSMEMTFPVLWAKADGDG